ncbi:hypothetical protein GF324_02015 [bacterium]|nr:hypothetical protein [bacterium]
MTVRALVYIHNRVHLPALMPVLECLRDSNRFQVAVSVHPLPEDIIAPLHDEDLDVLRSLRNVEWVETPALWNPDLAFTGDVIPFRMEGCRHVVNLGHGLLSKGTYFTNRIQAARENLSDLLCVPGPYHRERLLEGGRVHIPIVATGFPKLDPLFRERTFPREALLRRFGIPPEADVLLYAPTHNAELSAVPVLGETVANFAKEGRHLLIKLHGGSDPAWVSMHRELARRQENVHFIEEPDLTPWMSAADLMISDVSSAFMECICLDKPVVLINNPQQTGFGQYDPGDLEYVWRDVGDEAATPEEAEAAVEHALAHPEERSQRRRWVARQLLADREGRAAERVVEAALELLTHGRDTFPHPPVPKRGVCVVSRAARPSPLLEDVSQDDTTGPVDYIALPAAAVEHPDQAVERLLEEIAAGQKPYVMFSRGTIMGWNRWLFRLYNHFRSDPDLALLFPLIGGCPGTAGRAQAPLVPALSAERLVGLPASVKGRDAQEVDRYIRFMYAGGTRRVLRPPPMDIWIARSDADGMEGYLRASLREHKLSKQDLTRAAVARDVCVCLRDRGSQEIS